MKGGEPRNKIQSFIELVKICYSQISSLLCVEAKKGNIYVSAVRSSTSAAKQVPTVRNFTVELYLCSEIKTYSTEFHCGALPLR